MPIIPDYDNAEFVLTGPDFEPIEGLANVDVMSRQAYWRQVAVLARTAKYRELIAGIDVNGQRLRPIKYKRRDKADGPPLSPHYAESRVHTELFWRQEGGDSAVLGWRQPWGTIVTYWLDQGRDVIGLCDQSVEWIVNQARKWWAGHIAIHRLGPALITHAGTVTGAPPQTQTAGKLQWSEWGNEPSRPTVPPRPGANIPSFPAGAPAFKLVQNLHQWWQRAGTTGVNPMEADLIVARLARSATTPVLLEMAQRLGLPSGYRSRAAILDAIHVALLNRVAA